LIGSKGKFDIAGFYC